MKILLGTLKDRGGELATFLEPRIGAKPEVASAELTVEDSSLREGVKSRQVKTYIKRFLHKAGERKNYRVLVEGAELKLIEVEGEEEEEEKKESKKEEKVEKKEEAPQEPEPKKEKKEEAPKQRVSKKKKAAERKTS